MSMWLKNQVKEIIMVVITILIAVSINFSKQYTLLWIAVICLGAIQIVLVFVQSVEEKAYWEEAEHNHRQKQKDWKYDEECKDIKLRGKLKKLEEKSKDEVKLKSYIKFNNLNNLIGIKKW